MNNDLSPQTLSCFAGHCLHAALTNHGIYRSGKMLTVPVHGKASDMDSGVFDKAAPAWHCPLANLIYDCCDKDEGGRRGAYSRRFRLVGQTKCRACEPHVRAFIGGEQGTDSRKRKLCALNGRERSMARDLIAEARLVCEDLAAKDVPTAVARRHLAPVLQSLVHNAVVIMRYTKEVEDTLYGELYIEPKVIHAALVDLFTVYLFCAGGSENDKEAPLQMLTELAALSRACCTADKVQFVGTLDECQTECEVPVPRELAPLASKPGHVWNRWAKTSSLPAVHSVGDCCYLHMDARTFTERPEYIFAAVAVAIWSGGVKLCRFVPRICLLVSVQANLLVSSHGGMSDSALVDCFTSSCRFAKSLSQALFAYKNALPADSFRRDATLRAMWTLFRPRAIVELHNEPADSGGVPAPQLAALDRLLATHSLGEEIELQRRLWLLVALDLLETTERLSRANRADARPVFSVPLTTRLWLHRALADEPVEEEMPPLLSLPHMPFYEAYNKPLGANKSLHQWLTTRISRKLREECYCDEDCTDEGAHGLEQRIVINVAGRSGGSEAPEAAAPDVPTAILLQSTRAMLAKISCPATIYRAEFLGEPGHGAGVTREAVELYFAALCNHAPYLYDADTGLLRFSVVKEKAPHVCLVCSQSARPGAVAVEQQQCMLGSRDAQCQFYAMLRTAVAHGVVLPFKLDPALLPECTKPMQLELRYRAGRADIVGLARITSGAELRSLELGIERLAQIEAYLTGAAKPGENIVIVDDDKYNKDPYDTENSTWFPQMENVTPQELCYALSGCFYGESGVVDDADADFWSNAPAVCSLFRTSPSERFSESWAEDALAEGLLGRQQQQQQQQQTEGPAAPNSLVLTARFYDEMLSVTKLLGQVIEGSFARSVGEMPAATFGMLATVDRVRNNFVALYTQSAQRRNQLFLYRWIVEHGESERRQLYTACTSQRSLDAMTRAYHRTPSERIADMLACVRELQSADDTDAIPAAPLGCGWSSVVCEKLPVLHSAVELDLCSAQSVQERGEIGSVRRYAQAQTCARTLQLPGYELSYTQFAEQIDELVASSSAFSMA